MQELEIIQIDRDNSYAKDYMSIRREVFIIGQNVPAEIEIDEYDAELTGRRLPETFPAKNNGVIHVMARYNGKPAAAGRLIYGTDEAGKPNIAKIGRIAVMPEFRKRGIGSAVVKYLIWLSKKKGASKICLHAQCYIKHMYEKFGFKAHGDVFDEAGIDHIEMFMDVKK
ncbi:MAG TPA: GNAT family N-acetyltransferase [Candidatus Wallbacteria bacterium]|nr:GNAT family N-acetyltransferase [Candidatus Wallbacteria bacterium]